MKIFFTNETKKLDEYTIKNEPISSLDLMERAAAAVTFEIISRWKRDRRIVVFAGPGNNGGDALAVSRMLIEEGYKLEIYLFNPFHKLSPDCAKNKELLRALDNLSFSEVISEFTPPILNEDTLVIDGLFGAGLRTPLSGGFASVVQYINSYPATVISIDLPSGLFGENNTENNRRNIIRADLTLTFQYPKLSFMFAENERHTGEWKIIDIGLHPDILESTPSNYYYIEPENIALILKPRMRFAEKNNMGHILLVAGSYGMMGAAVLSARAVMHTGAGLVTVHSAASGFPVLQTSVPEALFDPDHHEKHITEVNIKRQYAAVGIGPGIGRNPETVRAIEHLINQLRRPAVIDADALNCLVEHPEILSKLPSNSILTPHIREFDRLFGKSDTAQERLEKAIETAKKLNLIIVLKGANTAVVFPKGEVSFNSSGNAGMATAGSGDALTGVILGLLSQGYSPKEAAVMGVFLHGLAGDIAAEENSQEFITASNIISRLGKAFKRISSYNVR